MSQSFQSSIADVTVLSGGTASRSVSSSNEYSDATAIHIQSPETLDVGTWTIQTSHDGITTWATLNDGTADIGPPGAGKSRQYVEMIGSNYWRISGPTTAADRIFKVTKQWTL